MDRIHRFIVVNTPESALLAALLTVAAGYLSGKLEAQAAILAAVAALSAFVFAEAHKDAATS